MINQLRVKTRVNELLLINFKHQYGRSEELSHSKFGAGGHPWLTQSVTSRPSVQVY